MLSKRALKKRLKRPVCWRRGHEWDIAAHGPGGSVFDCIRCGQIKEGRRA